MALNWQQLYSSHVAAAAYDSDGETGLNVRFTDGAWWAYPDADEETFKLLASDMSPGHIMHALIKPLYGSTAYRVE